MNMATERDINEIKQLLFMIFVILMCELGLKVCSPVVEILIELMH